MGERRVYHTTDLSIPQVEHVRDASGHAVIPLDGVPPATTKVAFGRNASSIRSFDFAPWYGGDIDAVTYACQRQIERFLVKQDAEIEASTAASYCNGLKYFLDFVLLRAAANRTTLALADINRDVIDGFLGYLRERGTATTSQKSIYVATKCVLVALGRRGLVPLVASGEQATFPRNPFPHNNRKHKGETPLPKRQREAFTQAVKTAAMPLWRDDVVVTGELLAYVYLIVALHTGRNMTPLLEMVRDCFRSHPKASTVSLVLWKRRGHINSKVTLRADSDTERLLDSTPSVRTNVERLIRRVLALTAPLLPDAPDDLTDRVWLYRSAAGSTAGAVTALTKNTLSNAIATLVTAYKLVDTNGRPLRINVSRLRKTFANRAFELAHGDLATTALALGNTPQVADRSYLSVGEEGRRNWQFMGQVLVEELLAQTIGATYRKTPMGGCGDPERGHFAPKQPGATCMKFTQCLRCKSYAVTGDDLYKLFSFYFRVFAERSRMNSARWEKEYAQIPRLIDSYIIAEGVRRGTFKQAAVDAAREHARRGPHPFWSFEQLPDLELFA